MKIASSHSAAVGGFTLVLLLLSPLASATSHSTPGTGIDEEALAHRITEQVMRELKESGFLEDQIELGIRSYIRKQREAQARAQAEQRQAHSRRAQDVRRVSADRDHVRGSADAEISLIEYSDFECPFCKRFHPTAMRAVEAYGGKVNWVYRHFPLGFHNPLAQKEAEASECAALLGGGDGFWRYADAIYERTRSNGNGFPIDGLVPLAVELGLDGSDFRECLDSGRFAARVAEDLEEGQTVGISGTPGNILLNNRTGKVRLVEGAVPFARLEAAIDELLAEQ